MTLFKPFSLEASVNKFFIFNKTNVFPKRWKNCWIVSDRRGEEWIFSCACQMVSNYTIQKQVEQKKIGVWNRIERKYDALNDFSFRFCDFCLSSSRKRAEIIIHYRLFANLFLKSDLPTGRMRKSDWSKQSSRRLHNVRPIRFAHSADRPIRFQKKKLKLWHGI